MWRLKYQVFIAHPCISKIYEISLFGYLIRKYYKYSDAKVLFVSHVTVQKSGFNISEMFFFQKGIFLWIKYVMHMLNK